MNDHPVWMSGPSNTLTRFGEIPLFREGLYTIAPDTYAWMVPNGSWGNQLSASTLCTIIPLNRLPR